MKIKILGHGAFGSFLRSLFTDTTFTICDDADTVILAVPLSAYKECGEKYKDKHLVNVCSVQLPSYNILKEITDNFTGIHPLFGVRTPIDKRNSILTHSCGSDQEKEFLKKFSVYSTIVTTWFRQWPTHIVFTPELHDELMYKTHVAAVLAAKAAEKYIDESYISTVHDELLPNSFRLLKQFVKTMDDMPEGTMSSILSNPYINQSKI